MEAMQSFEEYMARIDAKDLDGVFEMVAEDAEFHDCGDEPVRGKPALREMAESLFAGIPDNTITQTFNLISTDRVVMGEFETSGTHSGTYHGFPPTGRTITWSFASVYEFDEAGLLKRQAVYYDTAGLSEQLSGEAPASPSAG